jgi:adenosine deaminase
LYDDGMHVYVLRNFRTALFSTAATAALFLAATIGASAADSPPASSPTARTAAYLATAAAAAAANDPTKLTLFLNKMPKGGDLHHHLSGSVYAESYIQYAANDGDCIDSTYTILPPPCIPKNGIWPASRAITNYTFRNKTIDALSARNYVVAPGDASPQVHFFLTFFKFDLVVNKHWPEMLAEVTHRAALQHEIYIETMLSPDKSEAMKLGTRIGWTNNFDVMRNKLDAAGMPAIAIKARANLAGGFSGMRRILHCASATPDVGCGITTRFIAFVLRDRPIEQVFAQVQADFELAAIDPMTVSVNPVEAQDDYKSLYLYDQTMKIFAYFHKRYPNVHLTMHAGELRPGLQKPEDMENPSEIREAIEVAGAERIGHGIDVLHERDPEGLLAEMAAKHILVEVAGGHALLPTYIGAGVPVALATDDEGVNRQDLTFRFNEAVQHYHIDYYGLKKLVRDSLEHALIGGADLWSAPEAFDTMAAPCAGQALTRVPSAAACAAFVAASPRATLEWNEEVAFAEFESHY